MRLLRANVFLLFLVALGACGKTLQVAEAPLPFKPPDPSRITRSTFKTVWTPPLSWDIEINVLLSTHLITPISAAQHPCHFDNLGYTNIVGWNDASRPARVAKATERNIRIRDLIPRWAGVANYALNLQAPVYGWDGPPDPQKKGGAYIAIGYVTGWTAAGVPIVVSAGFDVDAALTNDGRGWTNHLATAAIICHTAYRPTGT